MQTVNSSFIAEIGYNAQTKTALVNFKKGGLYAYTGVPAETFTTWQKAKSIGSYYARNIKTNFRGTRVA